MMGKSDSILPSGYTKLSYITGNGAYIATGLRSTLPYTYECEVMYSVVDVRQLMGANGGNFFGVTNSGYWQNGQPSDKNFSLAVTANQWYKVKQYKSEEGTKPNYLYIDDVLVNQYSPSYTENSISVFASTTGQISTYASLKYFKIWLNGSLSMHLIPCIDPNNVVGMYDIIGQQFFGSANSRNFTGQ